MPRHRDRNLFPPRNPFGLGRGGIIRLTPAPARSRSPGRQPSAASSSTHVAAGLSGGPSPDEGAPGRRADAPPILGYRRGDRATALAVAADPARLHEAVQQLESGAYAATSAAPRAARAALWGDLLRAAGFAADDLSAPAFQAGVAALRAAGYRSAMNVADQAVCDARERGFVVGPALQRAIDKARRSCRRGLGPPRHTAPFPVERIAELPSGEAAWTSGGPLQPRRFLLVGSWWLTREIELSNALVQDVRVVCPGEISLTLPASKTDIAALGTSRSHKCACGCWASGPQLLEPALCPACALHEQFRWASARPGGSGAARPLFPSGDGIVSKHAAVQTIKHAAGILGLPLRGVAGAELWGGHALRRGGVQYLGRSGVEVWRIQALARHSSSAILGYLEGSHISTLNTVAAEAATGRTLDTVRRELALLQAEVASGAKNRADIDAALREPQGPSQASVSVPVSADNLLENPPAANPASAAAHPYILSTLPRGKLHCRHPLVQGLTRCGWAWGRHAAAWEVAEDFLAPKCLKCFPQGRAAAASGSSRSSSGASSSSAAPPSTSE